MKIDRRRFMLGASALASWSCREGSRSSPDAGPTPAPSASASSTLVAASRRRPAQRPPASPQHPDTLARFVDPLPLPPVLQPEGVHDAGAPGAAAVPLYRVSMYETEIRVHRDLKPVRMWSYGGSVPGPTIETRSGRALAIEWKNDLPAKHFLPIDPNLCGKSADPTEVRTVVHVHGAKVPPESDGYPDNWYGPGHAKVSRYPNQQDATALWYHDHAMGVSRLNQYAGLFGMFMIRDAVEDALDLPRGPHEVPLVIFDRLFDAEGQLRYPTSGALDAPWVPEVYGDAMLVNGKLYPYLDVEPRRYRLRVLNASNARFYLLSLSKDHPFHQIGTDQGLLPAPVEMTKVSLAPAERIDLVVDFSGLAGQHIVLSNQAFQLMQFRVAGGPVHVAGDPLRGPPDGGAPVAPAKPAPLPARLRPMPDLPLSAVAKTRRLTLNEYEDPQTHMMLMLLNATRWREPVTENPELDSVEVWELVNLTEDVHPIHLHLVRFRLVDRQLFDVDTYLTSKTMRTLGNRIPPAPEEAGWKDTIRADPGVITRIIIRFEGFPGRYAWHCHVLEHEANEMMRPYDVIARR